MPQQSTRNNNQVNGAHGSAPNRSISIDRRRRRRVRSATTANSTVAASITDGGNPGGNVAAVQPPIQEHPPAGEHIHIDIHIDNPIVTSLELGQGEDDIELPMPTEAVAFLSTDVDKGQWLVGVGSWQYDPQHQIQQ